MTGKFKKDFLFLLLIALLCFALPKLWEETPSPVKKNHEQLVSCAERTVSLGKIKFKVSSQLSAATDKGKTVFSRGCFTSPTIENYSVDMLTVYPIGIDIDNNGEGFTYQLILQPVREGHQSSYKNFENFLNRKNVSFSSLPETKGFKKYGTNYVHQDKNFRDIDGSPIVIRCSNIFNNVNDCSFTFRYNNELWISVRGIEDKDHELSAYQNPDITFWNKVLVSVKETVKNMIISDNSQ